MARHLFTKRTGAGGEAFEALAKGVEIPGVGALEVGVEHLPAGARGVIARRRAQGLSQRERVFELHVRQAMPLLQVARRLGLSAQAVCHHWRRLQEQIIVNAPRSPDDFAVLRERISAMLWQTIEGTCPQAEALPLAGAAEVAVDEASFAKAAGAKNAALGVAVPMPVPPAPMLAIRLKALEQLARLYDLGMSHETRAVGFAPLPYATPEEVGAAARERVLDLHERSE